MKAEKLTVTELAKRIGTNRTAVRRVLDEDNISISLATMFRTANALGLSLSLSAKRKTPIELGGIGTRLINAQTPHEADAITEELVTGFYGRTLPAETSVI